MNSLAIGLRTLASYLRRQGKAFRASMVDSAANEIERLSEQVRRMEAELKELKAKGSE